MRIIIISTCFFFRCLEKHAKNTLIVFFYNYLCRQKKSVDEKSHVLDILQ